MVMSVTVQRLASRKSGERIVGPERDAVVLMEMEMRRRCPRMVSPLHKTSAEGWGIRLIEKENFYFLLVDSESTTN
jgi:hypothetical protein